MFTSSSSSVAVLLLTILIAVSNVVNQFLPHLAIILLISFSFSFSFSSLSNETTSIKNWRMIYSKLDGINLSNQFILPQAYPEAALTRIKSFGNGTFFLKKDLAVGSKQPFAFPDHCKVDNFAPNPPSSMTNHAPKPPPPPPISLSTAQYFNIIRTYSIDPHSPTANLIKLTLERCERKNPVNGKVQSCVSSFEAMVTLVTNTLHNANHVRALSLPDIQKDPMGIYQFLGFHILANDENLLACHKLTFPFTVFYCHQPRNTSAYSVSLLGVESHIKSEVMAICHDDTNDWNPMYLGFQQLGVKPGTPLCHLLESSDILWYQAQED